MRGDTVYINIYNNCTNMQIVNNIMYIRMSNTGDQINCDQVK